MPARKLPAKCILQGLLAIGIPVKHIALYYGVTKQAVYSRRNADRDGWGHKEYHVALSALPPASVLRTWRDHGIDAVKLCADNRIGWDVTVS